MPLDIALLQQGYNQRIGRYGFSVASGPGGDVMFDSTQAYAVMTAVACDKGWWADRTLGSNLGLIKNLTSRTPSIAEAEALDALRPLEQLNQISSGSTATASKAFNSSGLNTLGVDLSWTTPGNNLQPQRASV